MVTITNSHQSNVKAPPFSLEAEQAVLGSVLLESSIWESIQDKLTEDDFYKIEHRFIFRAIVNLNQRDQPLDVLTVSEMLKQNGQLEQAGGEVYLFQLARNTPSITNTDAYADIVLERSILRRLIHTVTEIANTAFQPQGHQAAELLDLAESKILAISKERALGNTGPQAIQSVMTTAFQKIENLKNNKGAITGVETGFTDLDSLTSGLQPADLIIIAGRPSMGKTSFAMNIVEFVALHKKPVLVFSMEMPSEAIGLRLISSLSHIDQHIIRSGNITDEDWMRISSVVTLIVDKPLFIDDTPALTPIEVRTRARRLAKEHGSLGLIMIDYLQLMRIPGLNHNRVAEISEISRSLKALAKELQVPVIALSQLNRSLEQRTDKRPMMSDLRESGAIEQDADLILFIYRDEVYNPNTADKGIAEIKIAKHRNGPIGTIKLTFLNELTRFENYVANARYEGYLS